MLSQSREVSLSLGLFGLRNLFWFLTYFRLPVSVVCVHCCVHHEYVIHLHVTFHTVKSALFSACVLEIKLGDTSEKYVHTLKN